MEPEIPKHQSFAEEVMARARARVEFEKIQEDAAEGDLLSFEGIKPQYGIREMFLLTTFSAIVLMMGRHMGGIGVFFGLSLCVLAWGWFFVTVRSRRHDQAIEERLIDLERRHKNADLNKLPINAVRERNRG